MGNRRAIRAGIVAVAVAVIASACSFNGLNSLPVPGAQGSGDGSYQISAVIPNAGGLVSNAPVYIADATVGSVGAITLDNWNAKVTMRMNPGVKVPAGSHVMVGMTSVLGSYHLEIVQPRNSAAGFMQPGDTIALPRCPQVSNVAEPTTNPVPDINAAQQVPECTYPTTEQVLSSLSVILNGGGLSQAGDIVHEVSDIFHGREKTIADLIPRLRKLVSHLNVQRSNIISAMDGLDRLTATVNQQKPTLERALSDGPQILGLLNDERQQFVTTLDSVGKLSATTNDVLKANSGDIKSIVKSLSPAFKQFADAGPALPSAMRLLFTFPFAEDSIDKIIKGDYVNSDLVLDLTFARLSQGIFKSVGAVGPEGVVGKPAGAAGRGLDPFTSPLTPGGEHRPDTKDPVPAPGAIPSRKPAASSTTPANPGGGHR